VCIRHESYNNVKSGDYFVPDKRGVSVAFLDAATPSKAFYGTTIAATEITAGTWVSRTLEMDYISCVHVYLGP
jgi:hypothetical protein